MTPSTPARGRFDVWAPRPTSVRLSVGDAVVPMHRGDDDWWVPDGPVPDGEVDYGYLLDDSSTPVAHVIWAKGVADTNSPVSRSRT